jgi:hypothetical protein
MISKIEQLENAIKLSVAHLKAIKGGEEEDFCTDDRRDSILTCYNF